jgi:hypothetical protein
MDYQCIVIYTIVRIAPIYPPYPNKAAEKQGGCLDWIKSQIKRLL